ARGTGRATALALAGEGGRVAIWDLEDKATRVAGDMAVAVDVASESAVRSAVTRTVDALGPIDHLVHAAAIGSGKFGFPFTNLQPQDWRKTLDVNIMGMVHVAHAVAPTMAERKRGTMVFISSVAGQIGSQTDPPYSAAKAANINFAQCLAKDLAPHGVRVNTVCPGMVQTPLNRSVWQAWNDQQPPERQRSYEDWANEKVRNVIPLQRWQKPEDIANLVTFLS